MQLTRHQQAMLDGKNGKGAAMAMGIQVAIGEGFGASRMVPVTRTHVALSAQEADVWFASKLRDAGAVCAVPPTVNPGYCLEYFEPRGLVSDGTLMRKTHEVYAALGATLTYSCTPYLFGNIPRYGETVSFSETSVSVYANAVLGARTHREGAFSSLCAAVTGFVPEYGILLDENRFGTVLVTVEADIANDFEYAALGLCGAEIGGGVPVFANLRTDIRTEALIALGTQLNISGVYDMFHIVGVTPDAPDLNRAFGGKKPEREVTITREMIDKALQRYSPPVADTIGFVMLGCPHYTFEQVVAVESLLAGDAAQADIWVLTSGAVADLARSMGLADRLEKLNVRLVPATCVDQRACFSHLAGKGGVTDSPKCAYYMGAFGVDLAVRDVQTCIRWAKNGRPDI